MAITFSSVVVNKMNQALTTYQNLEQWLVQHITCHYFLSNKPNSCAMAITQCSNY